MCRAAAPGPSCAWPLPFSALLPASNHREPTARASAEPTGRPRLTATPAAFGGLRPPQATPCAPPSHRSASRRQSPARSAPFDGSADLAVTPLRSRYGFFDGFPGSPSVACAHAAVPLRDGSHRSPSAGARLSLPCDSVRISPSWRSAAICPDSRSLTMPARATV